MYFLFSRYFVLTLFKELTKSFILTRKQQHKSKSKKKTDVLDSKPAMTFFYFLFQLASHKVPSQLNTPSFIDIGVYSPFALCHEVSLGVTGYVSIIAISSAAISFHSNILKRILVNHTFTSNFWKEHSISSLMIIRLIDLSFRSY